MPSPTTPRVEVEEPAQSPPLPLPKYVLALRIVIALSGVALAVSLWQKTVGQPPEAADGSAFRTAAIARTKAPPKDPAEPGVMVTFQAPGQNAPPLDSRVDRMPALYVPAGSAPTPFVAPGRFAVMVEGDVNIRLRDTFTFTAAGRGTLKLTLNGDVAVEASGEDLSAAGGKPIQLNKGKNHLVLRYEAPATGDAWYRLYWASSDFPAEPVPPTILTHNPNLQGLRPALQLREGRNLFAQLRCANCHAPDASLAAAIAQERSGTAGPAAMPELTMDAPSLAGVGSRLNEAWLAHWISNPRAINPEAEMPRTFHDEGAAGDGPSLDPKALDIAAYLATLTASDALKPREAGGDEVVAAGGRLFAHLHCAACHTLPEADQFDLDNHRIPLAFVKAKYKPGALWTFLKNPQAHYAWNRMPNFKLSDVEADRLTAFLLSRDQKALEIPAAAGKGDPQRGQALLASSGCLNCHTLGSTTPPSTLKAVPLAGLEKGTLGKGCLAENPPSAAPEFNLTAEQRQALGAFVATGRGSLNRDNLGEFAQRQIQVSRCTNCHTLDGQDDLYAQVDNEVAGLIQDGVEDEPEGEEDEKIAPDQSLPMLTWAGEKLRPEWTVQLLQGKLNYRLRPWLRPRMPAFAARGAHLAQGLPLQHGFSPLSPADPAPNAELAAIGKKLVGKEGGFSCIACHGVGPMKPVGVFEAPGINLKYARERITPHYYTRWVYNPLRIHRETKMPTFADSSGQTSLKETLGGDARKQYQAIWNYLLAGREIQPPEN